MPIPMTMRVKRITRKRFLTEASIILAIIDSFGLFNVYEMDWPYVASKGMVQVRWPHHLALNPSFRVPFGVYGEPVVPAADWPFLVRRRWRASGSSSSPLPGYGIPNPGGTGR